MRNPENRGFSRANNQAARLARGRYLFFLNNDTVVPPGACGDWSHTPGRIPRSGFSGRACANRAAPFSGRGGVGRPSPPCCIAIPCCAGRACSAPPTAATGRDAEPETPRAVEALLGAALLKRRAVFREGGGWDEEFVFGAEDLELCARIGRRRAVVYHPGVEIIHHGRASSRDNLEYVYPNTVIGVTRTLRKCGASRWGLLLYKTALTFDVPLQGVRFALQYVTRRGAAGPRPRGRAGWRCSASAACCRDCPRSGMRKRL